MTTHTILRLPKVKATTGLSRSSIYLRVAEGKFPRPLSLGGRAIGWLESEVTAWLKARADERGVTPAALTKRKREGGAK